MKDHTPQRVVSLQPSATQILAELGLSERIVACTKWCAEVCPEIVRGGRTIVADSWTAKSSEVLAARPDLVIAAVPYQVSAVAEIMKAGVPFLGLAPRTLADIYGDIAKIAGIMGATEQGAALIARMQTAIEAVRQRARRESPAPWHGHNPRPLVFCEEWGKPIIASQRWVKELVEVAGGEFLNEPGSKPSAQEIHDAEPDVIVLSWCGAGNRVPLEKIVRERGWNAMVEDSLCRVYCVSDELLNTPGPALIKGLHALASAIQPEIFGAQAAGLRQMSALRGVAREHRQRM